MHLAGEPDAAHLPALHGAARQHPANGRHGRVPPVLGTLLRPQRVLHVHLFVRRRKARAYAAALIHKKRARAAGADIDSQPHDLPWCHTAARRGVPQLRSAMTYTEPC